MHVQDKFHLRKLLFSGFLSGFVLAATSLQAQPDPPPSAAQVLHLEGNVMIQPSGIDGWDQVSPNMPVNPGDRIYSQPDGRAALYVAGIRTYFDHNTDLTLINNDYQTVVIGLGQGSAEFYNNGLPPGVQLVVQTPNGALTVNGQAGFRVDVDRDDGYSVVSVFRYNGFVDVHSGGDFYAHLGPDESLQIAGTNPVFAQPLGPAGGDDFRSWADGIDSHRMHAFSLQYVSAEMPGVDMLDSSGDWQPQSPYGAIWFPRVQAGWAPYRYGHWVNRPFYGWTWVADEPWGAAPFHYGRWVVMNGRWGWIPGPREVHPIWSPAQVVFAGGVQFGGASLSVWIPLGPGEPYKPWYPCSPTYINQINIVNIRPAPAVHVQTDYVKIVNITNVTNVTNITYVNKTVGVTAMRQEDFAAGRPSRAAAVTVNATVVQNFHPAAPAAKPPAQPVIFHPVARPAAIPAARPVLINEKGQQAAAVPHAKPVPVPVKAAPPAPKPIPGRAVVGNATVGNKPAPPQPARPAAQTPAQPVKPAINQPQTTRPVNEPSRNAATPEKPANPQQQPKPAMPEAKPVTQEPKPAVQQPKAVTPQPKPALNPAQSKPAQPAAGTEAHPNTPNQQKPANQAKPNQGKNDKNKKPEDKKEEDKKPE
ncbi:DUF6600 domain-containing protein [Acidicapsa dinghuensis]|uniref:DUF6600 domain-containing protein n=1 Tax=Acidicapsa dinghuensis TaxID=2218256 RepID=A0ABW1EHY2_9BACT|nr:DUF6600 domain-containing protein [Acidicapsa dinghuensis]